MKFLISVFYGVLVTLITMAIGVGLIFICSYLTDRIGLWAGLALPCVILVALLSYKYYKELHGDRW